MKIQSLSDQALLANTLNLVKREKEILSDILAHLQEVHRRRLFCELGFGSLFQYCVKQLGYSEDQAYRRINALKLIREIPEVHEQIAKGELTLSSLSVAQSLFKADAEVDKKEVLTALKHKSKRELEKVIKEFSSKVAEFKKEVHLSLSPQQEEKWNAVKAKLAHCNLKEEEILERLCDIFLEPKPTPKAVTKEVAKASPRPAPPRSPASSARNVSMGTKRQVLARDQNRCTQCGSQYALQLDHKLPIALGGNHDLRNLRVLCRACNQRAAIRVFGQGKMGKFLGDGEKF